MPDVCAEVRRLRAALEEAGRDRLSWNLRANAAEDVLRELRRDLAEGGDQPRALGRLDHLMRRAALAQPDEAGGA